MRRTAVHVAEKIYLWNISLQKAIKDWYLKNHHSKILIIQSILSKGLLPFLPQFSMKNTF